MLNNKRPGPVATRDIERVLAKGGAPRGMGRTCASCRRMEAVGWLRTLRALAEQRPTDVVVLQLVPASPLQDDDPADLPVRLDNILYLACRGDYVVRLDGSTCLQLWNTDGLPIRLACDPLQEAQWLPACHDAGIAIRLQINESTAPEEGTIAENVPPDQTDSWYRQLEAELRALGISGLTEAVRLAVVSPEKSIRSQLTPAQLLHVLRESPDAFALTASTYEEDTGPALHTLLIRTGFTAAQVEELQTHRIRWPLMSDEKYDRCELKTLLDELERRQLFCKRDQLTEIVFPRL